MDGTGGWLPWEGTVGRREGSKKVLRGKTKHDCLTYKKSPHLTLTLTRLPQVWIPKGNNRNRTEGINAKLLQFSYPSLNQLLRKTTVFQMVFEHGFSFIFGLKAKFSLKKKKMKKKMCTQRNHFSQTRI